MEKESCESTAIAIKCNIDRRFWRESGSGIRDGGHQRIGVSIDKGRVELMTVFSA